MRKILTFISLIFVTLSLCAFNSDNPLSADIEKSTYSSGEIVRVNISYDGEIPFGGSLFTLTYDTSKLQYS